MAMSPGLASSVGRLADEGFARSQLLQGEHVLMLESQGRADSTAEGEMHAGNGEYHTGDEVALFIHKVRDAVEMAGYGLVQEAMQRNEEACTNGERHLPMMLFYHVMIRMLALPRCRLPHIWAKEALAKLNFRDCILWARMVIIKLLRAKVRGSSSRGKTAVS